MRVCVRTKASPAAPIVGFITSEPPCEAEEEHEEEEEECRVLLSSSRRILSRDESANLSLQPEALYRRRLRLSSTRNTFRCPL
ncbi:hypothetical protein E2C01_032326 [Portunus trituberculatus]|uniref:Uncharacterized protein n=1 Tax=Portunus trituberculatus TaxID=210409 RepID=A0A5B7EV15_PORTR|nr:hypothetical protein [Portunus trituberculatus]